LEPVFSRNSVMTNDKDDNAKSVSIRVTAPCKDKNDLVDEAVLALLVQQFPESPKPEAIIAFKKACLDALQLGK